MIINFKCQETEKIWNEKISLHFPQQIQRVALRKLIQLHAAVVLSDLKIPPGNRLEALKANRKGSYSIRVNEQWRICFIWTSQGPDQVEMVDYH